MATTPITALTAETAPAAADLVVIVDDVAGTPTTKKATVANLAASAPFSDLYAPLAGSVGGPPLIVTKTVDESVTSNTTNQDDDALLFAIAASQVWIAEFVIFYQSTTGGDLKVGLTAPAGASGRSGIAGLTSGATADSADLRATSDTLTANYGVGGAGATAPVTLILRAYIANSTTPGAITLTWAQLASSGTDTTVLAGSYLIAHRIA